MPGVTRLTTLPLIMVICFGSAAIAAPPGEVEDNFPLLSDEECWRRLPPAVNGGGQSLPSWARALTGPLPHSTAALLRLDYLRRTRSPLDPQLRARMRWVAAHANRCAYGEAYAAFDARRAGVDDAALAALRREDGSRTLPEEKAALEFARKMTINSASVTDVEFGALVKAYGEQKTAAMVLLMAYANFHDRLVLCLGSPLEAGGPKPPLDVLFARVAITAPPGDRPLVQPPPPSDSPKGKNLVEEDLAWRSLTYEELQARIASQRRRPTRLPIPAWEEVERGLPPGFFMRPNRMVWARVCLGYQPELAAAWETLFRVNSVEMRKTMSRILGVDLFWVTTRAGDCPYCMGHSEMLLGLAGFTKPQVAERCRLLAGDDWLSIPPAVVRTFVLARKLTRAPWSVSAEDMRSLTRDFGPARAAAITWWLCRGNYLNRVANGFQLSLEDDRDFLDYVINAQAPINRRQ